jgi:PhnB protein
MAKKKLKVKSKPKAQMKSKPKAKRIAAKPKSSASRKAAAPRKSVKTSVRAPGYQWINAYLTVRDVAQAIDFYTKGFGFRLRASMPGPDGKIMHAEMFHNDSILMMGPENPQAPAPQGPSPVTLFAYVDDVDALTAQAQAAGANVVSPPKDEFWGDRCAILVDPQGHTWMLGTHKRDLSMEDMKQAMGG